MLDALSTPQRALADYMSELSEEAYCAGWMDDLEFSLWRIVTDGSGRYGSMEITEKHVSKLRALSRLCGGWIVFDDRDEETFVTLREWQRRYTECTKNGLRLLS